MLRLLPLLLLLLVAGCHKDTQAADDLKPINLPGADKVLSSLASKDYEAVMTGMTEIRTALEPAKKTDYDRLMGKVMGTLMPVVADNEKAMQAYRAISAMEAGR